MEVHTHMGTVEDTGTPVVEVHIHTLAVADMPVVAECTAPVVVVAASKPVQPESSVDSKGDASRRVEQQGLLVLVLQVQEYSA